ncbi:MAG TPA: GlxA family transcriptional regulator [Steroidobacteraceae bacterium]|jgi:transcriptional regulator GlxA family with amidase domain|nr:GlxA family transcriptional regulator [Steroidobacteraceae bacterium]
MLRIGYVVAPGFQVMALAGLSVFEMANADGRGPHYDVRLLSERGGLVRSSFGAVVETQAFGKAAFDTVIVGGSQDVRPASRATIMFIRKALKSSRRLASVCTGAFALADAGVLEKRRVTTHWAHARDLQKRYPAIKVDEDCMFIIDGPIWTSAGMTAGIDLALGMVERDLGTETAQLVAKKLVVYHRRAGGQSQHSVLDRVDATSDRIQNALIYARKHLRASLSVEQLAHEVSLSPRQFSRIFRAETGQTPAKAIENMRVEAARLMMEKSDESIDTVASKTGFSDRERMRRAFLRSFGQPPQVLRRNAQANAS